MAITLETLPTPTINTIGDSATSGSLVPGETWYFRVVAVKGYYAGNQYMDSPWMIEASWTVGVGKSAIDISWNAVAGADRYYVLGTQVSGDYDETVQHVVGYNINGTSFTWTGAWPSSSYKYFWYRPDGVPNIIVEGGSVGSELNMEDIYAADVAGGWNRVKPQEAISNVEYNAGAPRPGLLNSWVVDATMTFGDSANCYFKEKNSDMLVLGALRFDNTYTKLFQLGVRSGSEMGEAGSELRVRGTCDVELKGVCNIYASSLITEGSEYDTWNRASWRSAYAHTWKIIALSTNASATVAIVTSQIYGSWSTWTRKESGTDLHNLYIGMTNGLSVQNDATISYTKIAQCRNAALLLKYYGSDGSTFVECQCLQGNGGDLRWERADDVGNDTILVDCIFESKGQTDNDPYFFYCRPYTNVDDGSLVFKHQFDPIFVDTDGNPLNGYTITLVDSGSSSIINDTTGADGKLIGGAVNVTRRIITADATLTGQYGKYLSWMIAQGYFNEDNRNPHTLTVSKDGTDYLVASFDIEARMTSYIIVDLTQCPPRMTTDINEFQQMRDTQLEHDVTIPEMLATLI